MCILWNVSVWQCFLLFRASLNKGPDDLIINSFLDVMQYSTVTSTASHLGNIIHLTLKKDGRCMEKIQPYILTPWGNVIRCQCSRIFFIQRAKIWNASTLLKQKWFQTILYLKTMKCYINLLPYLLIIIIPFDLKNSLVRQGRFISTVRNLKCRDVKSFAHCKREKVMTRT